jgi:predicted ATPase
VFLAPPWPEIYETDPERRHGLDVALVEYSRLLETYPPLGYEVLISRVRQVQQFGHGGWVVLVEKLLRQSRP